MNTPDLRRGWNFTKGSKASVRTNLNDQLEKLQEKHEAEVDFLRDMKKFSKQRSDIEREYSQSLQKLVQQYISKREIQDPSEGVDMDHTKKKGLLEVWRMLLHKTEELARARQNVSEMLSQISDDMRQQKRTKKQTYKRYIEMAQKMSAEVSDSVNELVECKSTYCKLEKECSDAKEKFDESDTRQRTQSQEKTHKKCLERLNGCQKKTAVARNEYLLLIATTNAHLHRHSTKDLPNLMRTMDREMYEHAQSAYMRYAQTEADAAAFVKVDFEDLRDQASLVNQEYVVECFLHNNPTLKNVGEYKFEPHGKDSTSTITREHGAGAILEEEAREWVGQLKKHQMDIEWIQEQVKKWKSVTSAYTEHLPSTVVGKSGDFSEAQSKIEEYEEDIRQVEVKVTKVEARLNALRGVGMDVSQWLEKPQGCRAATSTSGHPLSGLLSGSRDLSASEENLEGLETSPQRPHSEIYEDASSSHSGLSENNFCVAIYEYKAMRPDELDILVNEELEILEWDNGDGWCKGRNQSGKEGLFPQSYVRLPSHPSSPLSVQQMMDSQLRGQAEKQLQELGTQPIRYVTTHEHPAGSSGVAVPTSSSQNITQLRALYAYTAQKSGDLSFPQGATIELLQRDDSGANNWWWKGRYQGKVGVFPFNYVEFITN